MERVQKLLAAAGVSSRRQAEKLILAGRVTVNGAVLTLLGTQVDPARDVVAVDGVPVRAATVHATLMLNKPAGFITTRSDPHARETVMSLVPKIPGLHPIGRLDQDTTGLLLLTTDGALTYALTHPRHQVEKTYQAWVRGNPDPEALRRLREGVMVEGRLTAPARVGVLKEKKSRTLLAITIHEGRKRQVRRMCKAVGYPVESLTRTRLGPLKLGTLPEGKWRELTDREVAALFKASGAEEKE
jgi:pseudouridine synthase